MGTSIITRRITQDFGQSRFRAPAGKQYLIRSIIVAITTAGDNAIQFWDRPVEDDPDAIAVTVDRFITFPADAINVYQVNFHNFKVKTITYAVVTTSIAFEAFLTIEYDLIKFSKIEALWDWFRQGR